ncbi:fatty acid desaturase family protein [Hyphomonas sp. FCG-A18]|uniref:fatty acid desaturase family protein n=1 Tax=Hyphomonas sp. FCG-A18 TaxID=3080019 RepID=UPI002B2FBBB2|nr:fatty acid desaturase family protein [Hyphomonas sp. FCG-A18]
MPVAKRIRPLDLFTKEEWAHVSRRSDLLGLGTVVHAWSVIILAMAAAIWQPWLIILAIPVIGARQLGLAILMHEAAHGGLSKNGKINEWVGHWPVGAPIGASLKAYRPYHLNHHKYAQQPEDPDLILSAPFPVTRSSLRRKIIRDLTGQTFYKQRVNQFANAMGLGIRNTKGAENRSQSAREAVIPFLITNMILLTVLTLLGHWWAYFVLWLLPMATWNQLITRLRNIAEHAVVPDHNDPMRHARTTRANLLERAFIAPYWVNYHCEHHMFMHLPCYRLPEAHALLRKKGITAQMEVQDGYLTVLKRAASKPEAQPA